MYSHTQDNKFIEIKRAIAHFANEAQKRLFFFYQSERPDFHIPPQVEVHIMEDNTACITHHTIATNHHYTMCFINLETGDIHKPISLKDYDEFPLGNILQEGEQFIGRDGNFWIPRPGNWPANKKQVRSPTIIKTAKHKPFKHLASQMQEQQPNDHVEAQPLHLATEYDNTYGENNRT